jgi:hypothetical protein
VGLERLYSFLDTTRMGVDSEALGVLAVAMTLTWWTGLVLRCGRSYAGPADGPGWRPREPRCVECGYRLTSLPLDGRCSECGVPVAASLPAARRLPPWATARGLKACVRGYVATVKAILRDRAFFRKTPVSSGREAAVRFMSWTASLAGILVALGAASLGADEIQWRNAIMIPVVLLFVALFSGLCFVLLVALAALRGAWVRGTGLQPAALAVCYASVLFLPGLALVAAAAWWAYAAVSNRWVLPHALDLLRNPRVLAFYVVTAGPPVAAFIWAVLRLRRALFDVRFAAR